MYLFIINSIFIALATFLVIKYLRFPMVRYANSKRRRTISRVVSLTGLIVMIPAGFTFYEVLQESLFEREARAFLAATVESYQFESSGVYRSDFTRINYNHGKNPEISLIFIGDEVVPQSVINTWEVRKNQYKRLRDARLVIPKQQNEQVDAARYVLELYESKKAELLNKDERIRLLEEELASMSKSAALQIPFDQISREIKAGNPRVINLGFSFVMRTDFQRVDTIPVFELTWANGTDMQELEKDKTRIASWLKERLNNTRIEVKSLVDSGS